MDPMTFKNHDLGLKRALQVIAFSEWKALKKNKSIMLSLTMNPLLSYGMFVMALNTSFGMIQFAGVAVSYKQYALTGILATFVTEQMSQAMFRVTSDKEYGLLTMKFINGVQPWQYILGMNFFPLFGVLFQSIILITLGLFTSGIYDLVWLLSALPVVIVSLGFWTALGTLLSMKIEKYEKKDILLTLVFAPIMYAAPTLYVFSERLPLIVRVLAILNPLTYQLQALRTVAFGTFELIPLVSDILLTLAMIGLTQYILRKVELKLVTR